MRGRTERRSTRGSSGHEERGGHLRRRRRAPRGFSVEGLRLRDYRVLGYGCRSVSGLGLERASTLEF